MGCYNPDPGLLGRIIRRLARLPDGHPTPNTGLYFDRDCIKGLQIHLGYPLVFRHVRTYPPPGAPSYSPPCPVR